MNDSDKYYVTFDLQFNKVMVISDLHLGDPRLAVSSIISMIKAVEKEKPELLIFAGDTYEDIFSGPGYIYVLRKLFSDVEKVVFLSGNHDGKVHKIQIEDEDLLLGKVCVGTCGGKSFVVEHGHRFDSFWKKLPGVGRFIVFLNILLFLVFKFDFQKWVWSKTDAHGRMKKQHTRVKKYWKGFDIVISGHTHVPILEEGYANGGDWVHNSSYVIIDNGVCSLGE